MKDIRSLDAKEFRGFLDSFDKILCDADGVLWLPTGKSVTRALDCIRSLQKLGKSFGIVTNNTAVTLEEHYKAIKTRSLSLGENDFFFSLHSMINFLKQNNFTKDIYVCASRALKSGLKEAGFKILDDDVDRIDENARAFSRVTMAKNDNVGAVIFDLYFNLNYVRLQKAANFLQNPDIIFLCGAEDKVFPINDNQICVGPGYFKNILEEITGRKPVTLGKPGRHLSDYIVEKLKIENRERVLFVGDLIPVDMGFASNAGFGKLLVLSGATMMDDVLKWRFPEQFKPDYYVESLGVLQELIERHSGQILKTID